MSYHWLVDFTTDTTNYTLHLELAYRNVGTGFRKNECISSHVSSEKLGFRVLLTRQRARKPIVILALLFNELKIPTWYEDSLLVGICFHPLNVHNSTVMVNGAAAGFWGFVL